MVSGVLNPSPKGIVEEKEFISLPFSKILWKSSFMKWPYILLHFSEICRSSLNLILLLILIILHPYQSPERVSRLIWFFQPSVEVIIENTWKEFIYFARNSKFRQILTIIFKIIWQCFGILFHWIFTYFSAPIDPKTFFILKTSTKIRVKIREWGLE